MRGTFGVDGVAELGPTLNVIIGLAAVRFDALARDLSLGRWSHFFAAASFTALRHESPYCDHNNNNGNCWQDDFLAHEGALELGLEFRFFIRSGGVHLDDIHLQVGVGVV